MNSLVLRIFFHGLIAFLPNRAVDKGPDRMTAFFVNHYQHVSSLWFEMNKSSLCPKESIGSGTVCGKYFGWCSCTLADDVNVSFASEPVRLARNLSADPGGTKLKTSNTDKFSWLVRMADVEDGKPFEMAPVQHGWFNAEMSFGWVDERSCHLDQIGKNSECDTSPKSGCDYQIWQFKFALADKTDWSKLQQPLSEYVMFETRFPPLADAGAIFLVSATYPDQKIELNLGCGTHSCPDLLMENNFVGEETDNGVGNHFDAFYDLAKDGSLPRRIPFRYSSVLAVGDSQLFTCPDEPLTKLIDLLLRLLKKGKNANEAVGGLRSTGHRAGSRIVCPMAMFDPPADASTASPP